MFQNFASGFQAFFDIVKKTIDSSWTYREYGLFLLPEYLFLLFLLNRVHNVQLSSEQRLTTPSINVPILLVHTVIVCSYLINICILDNFKPVNESLSSFLNFLFIFPALSWTASYKLFKLETSRGLPRSKWTHRLLWDGAILANFLHLLVDFRKEILFQNMISLTRAGVLAFSETKCSCRMSWTHF